VDLLRSTFNAFPAKHWKAARWSDKLLNCSARFGAQDACGRIVASVPVVLGRGTPGDLPFTQRRGFYRRIGARCQTPQKLLERFRRAPPTTLAGSTSGRLAPINFVGAFFQAALLTWFAQ